MVTKEAAGVQAHLDSHGSQGQISELARVAAVDAGGWLRTLRTQARLGCCLKVYGTGLLIGTDAKRHEVGGGRIG